MKIMVDTGALEQYCSRPIFEPYTSLFRLETEHTKRLSL